MVLKFMDGFDSVGGTTSAPEWIKYDVVEDSASGLDYSSTSGRFGGGALVLADNGGTDTLRLIESTAWSSEYIGWGFWLKIEGAYPAGNSAIARLFNSSRLVWFYLAINPFGQLFMINWDNTNHSTLLTTPTPLELDAWHWVECRFQRSVSGVADIAVDGIVVDSFTGNTSGNGSGWGNGTFELEASSGLGGSCRIFVDDFIVYDDAAGVAGDPQVSVDYPIGPLKIEQLVPNSTGSNAGFTSSSTDANWENVDEVPPDDDTSYNSSTSYSAVDTHNFSTLTTTETITSIIGVQVSGVGRKDGANTMLGETVVVSSGSTANGTSIAFSTGYAMFRTVHTEDPATSTAWTTGSLDSVEFGYALSSST